jgi:hypothetical protein
LIVRWNTILQFYHFLKILETKHEYRKCILKFISNYNLTFEIVLSLPPRNIDKMLVGCLLELNIELRTSFINLNFAESFLFMNEVVINKKIGKFLGRIKKEY